MNGKPMRALAVILILAGLSLLLAPPAEAQWFGCSGCYTCRCWLILGCFCDFPHSGDPGWCECSQYPSCGVWGPGCDYIIVTP